MKKILQSLLITTLAATSAQAADYKPLLEEGKSWQCLYRGSNNSSDNPHLRGIGMTRFFEIFTAEVAGDTIVDGKQCKRIIRRTPDIDNTSSYVREYLLSEENEVVSYCQELYDGNHAFIPMMRFDVSAGDKIQLYLENGEQINEYRNIQSVDTVVGSDGVKRREVSIGYTSWVEGIGFSAGFEFMLKEVSTQDSYWEMDFKTMECSLNGQSIFKKKDFKMQFDEDGEVYETMFPVGKSWTMARGEEVFTVSVVGETYVAGIPATKLIDSNGKEYIVIEDRGTVYSFFDHYGKISPLYNAVPLMNSRMTETSSFNRYFFGKDWEYDYEKEEYTNRYPCKIREINTLTVKGVDRKEWVIENEDGDIVASWVDGIGSPNAASWANMEMPADYDLRMIDCRQDGEVIFSAEDFTYQSGIREVNADAARSSAAYDLQGRRVANPTRGLYILNGKKQLIR